MSTIERTLIIIKPHVFKGKSTQEKQAIKDMLVKRYQEEGLVKIGEKIKTMSQEEAEAFYAEHKDKSFFDALMKATVLGPCLIMILQGENAIKKVRDLHGPTNQAELRPEHLRFSLAKDEEPGGPYTGLHASDSPHSFERECKILRMDLSF